MDKNNRALSFPKSERTKKLGVITGTWKRNCGERVLLKKKKKGSDLWSRIVDSLKQPFRRVSEE